MRISSPVGGSLRRAAVAAAMAILASACTSSSPGPDHTGGPTANRPDAATYRLRVTSAGYGLSAPVQREVAVYAGGVILIAGGLSASGVSASGVYSLDPATGRLSSLGSVPQAFHDAAGAMIDGKLFVFGGGAGQSSDAVQTFDPLTAKGAVVSHLPIALSDLVSAVVGGTVYLVGGYDGSAPRAEIYATLDGTHFETAGMLPVGLRYAAVASDGTGLIISGGVSATGPVDTVSRFDAKTGKVSLIGDLPAPVGHAAAFALGGAVYVAGGMDAAGHAVAAVTKVDVAKRTVTPAASLDQAVSDPGTASTSDQAWIVGGWRGSAVSQVLEATWVRVSPPASTGATSSAADLAARPFAGLMVMADRGNNRILVMDADKHIVWTYPSPTLPAPPGRFYYPDDAFWVHGGNAIIVNQEENDFLLEIAYPSGKVIWQYGHQGVAGSAAGYTHQPDDLYPLPGGGAVVADAKNCRILFFDAAGKPSRQIGTNGVCVHGLPSRVGYPNGDTPLANGDFLLSELNGGWIDEVKPDGTPVWQLRVPGITTPSDPQQLADGTFMAVDYNRPGAVVRFTSTGQVLWYYHPTSGHGMLNHPSLAAPLPNGLVAVNDDFRHRIILIDPATNQIVWQYGVDDVAGSAYGRMSYPDGLDLLLPGGIAPLHVDFPSTQIVDGRP